MMMGHAVADRRRISEVYLIISVIPSEMFFT